MRWKLGMYKKKIYLSNDVNLPNVCQKNVFLSFYPQLNIILQFPLSQLSSNILSCTVTISAQLPNIWQILKLLWLILGLGTRWKMTAMSKWLQLLFYKNIWWKQQGWSKSADAGGPLQSSEYRARHVNDECSEAAAPLPGARKGTEYANVLPKTWIAKVKKKHNTACDLLYLYP